MPRRSRCPGVRDHTQRLATTPVDPICIDAATSFNGPAKVIAVDAAADPHVTGYLVGVDRAFGALGVMRLPGWRRRILLTVDAKSSSWTRLVKWHFRDQADLYALALAAVVFTLLGAVGIASTTTLSSLVLGLLAAMALSQVKSRRQVSELIDGIGVTIRRYSRGLPSDYIEVRRSARSALIIGVSLVKTLSQARDDIRRIMLTGGDVRVLLVDPRRMDLLENARDHHPGDVSAERISSSITHSLLDLSFLRFEATGNLQVRTAEFLPRSGFRVFDAQSPLGVIFMQYYEYRPASSIELFTHFSPRDTLVYPLIISEVERIWNASNPVEFPSAGGIELWP